MQMSDPSEALFSFQNALRAGVIDLKPGEIEKAVFVHFDRPNDKPRFTYVKLEAQTVIALAMFVILDSSPEPWIQTGYAVPKKFRNQGHATGLMRNAIAELKNGLRHVGLKSIQIEAIVGVENLASQRVAAKVISATPTSITDNISGQPALQYILRIDL